MRKFKGIFSFILVLLLGLILVACGGDGDGKTFELKLPKEVEVVTPTIKDLTKVAKDTEVTLKVNVPDGKQVDKFTVAGEEKQLVSFEYTFKITKNVEVKVTFKDIDTSIKYNLTLGQGITASQDKDIVYGTKVTITVTPGADKEIDELKVDGVKVNPTNNTYELTVTGNHNITVSFKNKGSGGETDSKGKIYDLSEMKPKRKIVNFWFDDEDKNYVNAVIKAFEDKNPDIAIRHSHMGSVEARETLKLLGLSGGGPDIFGFPHDHLAPAVEEGLLLKLSTDFENKLNETLHPDAMRTAKFQGTEDTKRELYAVPSSIETTFLYYNKELIEQLGETGPVRTFEEVITNAEKFGDRVIEGTTDTNRSMNYQYLSLANHWADSYYIQMLHSAFEFTPFGPQLNDPSAVGFADPKAQQAYTYYRDNIAGKISYGNINEGGSGANFEEGKVPYIIAGPWNYESFKAKLGAKLGLATLPSINGKDAGPFAGAQLLGISKFTKVQSEARRFLEFLASPEAGKILFEKKQKVPALKLDIINADPDLKDEDMVVTIMSQTSSAIYMPAIPEVAHFWGPSETLYRAIFTAGVTADIDALTEIAEQSYKTLVQGT